MKYAPQLVIYGNHYDCVIAHPDPSSTDWWELAPGETANLLIETLVYVPLEKGLGFEICQGPQVVARGEITRFLDVNSD